MTRDDRENMAALTFRKPGVPVRMARGSAEREATMEPGLGLEGVVDRTLGKLSHDEEQVLRMRFGIGERTHNLGEIGERYGLSRGWVRQIETRALRHLRADALGDWGDLH